MLPVVERNAVRALIVADGHLLLMQMAFPWRDGPFWITPGGGIEDGEEPALALARELAEELGPHELVIGPEVWHQTVDIPQGDHLLRQHERFFLVSTSRFTPASAGMTAHERSWFLGFRWWPLDVLASEASIFDGAKLEMLARADYREHVVATRPLV